MKPKKLAGSVGRSLIAVALALTFAAPTAFSKDVQTRNDHIRVKQAQCLLHRAGYSRVGPIDGIVGPKTRGAVMAFQRDHNLMATGHLNRRTLAMLSGPMARRGVATENNRR